MNNIDNFFTDYINNLDNNIIKLLSIRINYKTNSYLYRYDYNNNNVSILDEHLYIFEKNNIKESYKSYEKLFNPLLKKNIYDNKIKLEDLNLNKVIKQIYLFSLYDICEHGDDDKSNIKNIIDLDIEILYKLSERIHFGYEIIKLLYLENKIYFNNFILNNNNSEEIKLHIHNKFYEIDYIDNIKQICLTYNINWILICTLYKTYIIPFYLEVQLHFITKLIQLN